MTPRLLSFWLAVLLGSVAIDQSKADDGLAPQNSERSVQIPQFEPAAPEQQLALERERSRSEVLQRELDSARMELEAARDQAHKAQGLAEEQRELASRERAVNAVLQQDFLMLRKEIENAKGAQEENVRRELATAGQELALMTRVAEGLARDLALAQRAYERLRADAVVARDAAKAKTTAITQTGAMRSRQLAEADARLAGEALARERERAGSLATDLETARRERDAVKLELTQISEALQKSSKQEHEKAVDLARDLAEALRSIEALKAKAKTTAITQTGAMRSRQLAEADARLAGEALTRERERAGSLATDLATARRERDAVKLELTQISEALQKSSKQEHEKAVDLARDLAEALRSIEALEAKAKTTAITQTGAMRSRQLAEADARLAGEALARERERAGSLATDLATARRERDAVKLELTQISEALEKSSKQEHEKAVDLARDLVVARKEIDALKDQIERRTSRVENAKVERLERDLAEALRSIEALEAKAKTTAITQTGAMRSRQLAEADARLAGEALARERERAGSLATDLETARRERDAVKLELTQISEAREKAWKQEHEKAVDLARDLVAARKEIDASRVENAKVERLERDLAEALRSIEALEAKAKTTAITQIGAMLSRQLAEADARLAGEALAREREWAGSLATDLETARRERDAVKLELTQISEAREKAWKQEHEKAVDLARDLVAARKEIDASRVENANVERLERDLAEALRSIEALEAKAKTTAITQTGAMRSRQLAEADARLAGEALARERERAGSLATDLETARRERDAVKLELTRSSEALEEAWKHEHEKAVDLARDLDAARKEIDALKGQIERRTSRVEDAAKARPTDHASVPAEQRKSARRQKVAAQMRKPRAVRLTTIVLPDELLPTRPPVKGFRQ